MRVHLIKEKTIRKFVARNPQSSASFNDWILKVRFADWKKPDDIKATFGSTDILGKSSQRVVFDISGNGYRMICKYAFGENEVHLFVCWIGTHSEYTQLCKKGKQFTVNIY